MARVTALQLLNRVMLYRRQPEVAAFQSTNPEHVATLNALNMAKEDILGTRRWEFDIRHNGQLITKASFSSRGLTPEFTAISGDTSGSVLMTGLVAADETIGDFVTRIIPTGDADYSKSSFRVGSVLGVSDTAVVTFPFETPKAFTSVDCDLIYSEYMLPDTVREVVRVSHEQQEISLEQIDPTIRFDELVPSFSFDSGSPRIFSVGGFDTATHATTDDPDPKLRAVVWPIPDDEYVISYSYYYRHPDFADGDDELIGVPPDVVNDIVFAATSVMGMAWDSNFSAAHFGDMAQTMANAKHNAYSGSSGRRHTIRSWDSGRSMIGQREGFPGRVIGGG